MINPFIHFKSLSIMTKIKNKFRLKTLNEYGAKYFSGLDTDGLILLSGWRKNAKEFNTPLQASKQRDKLPGKWDIVEDNNDTS